TFQESTSSGITAHFLHQSDTSESPQCAPSRLVRRQARAEVLSRQHVDVEPQLLIDLGLYSPLANQRHDAPIKIYYAPDHLYLAPGSRRPGSHPGYTRPPSVDYMLPLERLGESSHWSPRLSRGVWRSRSIWRWMGLLAICNLQEPLAIWDFKGKAPVITCSAP